VAIDKEKMDRIRAEAQKAHEAGLSMSKNMLTIWTAQLDMAIAMEDEEMVKQVLRDPKPAWFDTNSGCVTNNCVKPI
jgi:hypothetical protein